MAENPYLPWPVFRRSIVAAFQRSLTAVSVTEVVHHECLLLCAKRVILENPANHENTYVLPPRSLPSTQSRGTLAEAALGRFRRDLTRDLGRRRRPAPRRRHSAAKRRKFHFLRQSGRSARI